MEKIIYAVGDIHGRVDLLTQLHEHILEHHRLLHAGVPGEIIHLGDYIDGGAHSIDVVDLLMRGFDDMSNTCLLGNHEAMMLDCLETDNRDVWYTWLTNGGDQTLDSLGISLRHGGYDPTQLSGALGKERILWLRSRPLYRIVDPYLFVHAGIAPGIPIEQQNPKDLLWIRTRFLESREDHGHIVVHGHTPGDDPVTRPNRICVDTGATSNGQLTAVVLAGSSAPLFLRATGPRGKTGNA